MKNFDWNQEATNTLKAELVRQNIKYEELILRLEKIGVKQSGGLFEDSELEAEQNCRPRF